MTSSIAQTSSNNNDKNLDNITEKTDRNFDEIADHFEKKVYGGLKGQIRLAVLRHDLFERIADKQRQLDRPLRILDIGAGFAQISIELADMGHDVTINDISINMLKKAQSHITNTFGNESDNDTDSSTHGENSDNNNGNGDSDSDSNRAKDLMESIQWIACPYQQLNDKLTGKYDVILCHAVLEWLAEPREFVRFSRQWLITGGYLSLCFYNPASFIYRNLIMGNFRLLDNTEYKADNKKSLTPNNPVDRFDVYEWLKEDNFSIVTESGLRVFHDYSPLKRGGHTNPDDVITMEVRYSSQEPFKWLGRYLHVLVTLDD